MIWQQPTRTYVLDPKPKVTDPRTGVRTSDARGVLDGDLDRFMLAALVTPKVAPDDSACVPD